jgi:hypothetical protein
MVYPCVTICKQIYKKSTIFSSGFAVCTHASLLLYPSLMLSCPVDLSRLSRPLWWGASIAIAAPFTLLSSPAAAFTVTPNANGNSLLNALLGETPGLTNFEVALRGNSQAFGTFANDPFGLGSGVVLSTGQVADLPGRNQIDGGLVPQLGEPNDLSTAFSNRPIDWSAAFGLTPSMFDPGTVIFDLAQLIISFDADDTVSALFFDYVFGSEEFVEFGGSPFNDQFLLSLNGNNLARLSDGQTVSINNLVQSPLGPFHPDYINNPVGSSVNTRLDGFTRPLAFTGDLLPNQRNTLVVSIFDVSDAILDSAVFLQGGSIRTVPEPSPEPEPEPPVASPAEPVSVPEPGMMLGLFGVAIAWGWKQRQV